MGTSSVESSHHINFFLNLNNPKDSKVILSQGTVYVYGRFCEKWPKLLNDNFVPFNIFGFYSTMC